MSVSYTNTDEGFMFKVGDLVAIKCLYKDNTWTDVFKIVVTGHGYVEVAHCGTNRGKQMFTKENRKYNRYNFDYFILIPELNKREMKSHLPKWW